MKKFVYQPENVCTKLISFELDEENKIHDLSFQNGCPGNLSAIGKLVEGKDAKEIIQILKGNVCGNKLTSCADQLALALEKVLFEKENG